MKRKRCNNEKIEIIDFDKIDEIVAKHKDEKGP